MKEQNGLDQIADADSAEGPIEKVTREEIMAVF